MIKYEKDPDNNERFWITINGEPWRAVHCRLFSSRPVFKKDQFFELEYRFAYQYALKSLSAKAQLKQQLEEKLKKRLVSQDTIDKILKECTHLGYLDDNYWIEQFIRRQIARRIGPLLIIQKLIAKGVPQFQAKQHVESTLTDKLQLEQLKDLFERKYKKKNLSCPKERQKVTASLMRKGYGYSQIKEVLT